MSELNVVYTTDDNYVPMCGVSLSSLFENNRSIDKIQTFILGKKLSKNSIRRLEKTAESYQRKITIIDNDIVMPVIMSYLSMYSRYKDPETYSELAYIYSFRLVLADVLPKSVDRIMYIGSDTLIIGEIESAYNVDLGEKSVAIAYDTMNKYYRKYIGLSKDDSYYNDDVLIIDLKKWRNRNLSMRVFEHVAKYSEKYAFIVQDSISTTIQSEICTLSIKYNMRTENIFFGCFAIKKMYGIKNYYSREEYEAARNDIRILHFSGQSGGRPWFSNSMHPKKKEYDKYYFESEWKDIPQKSRELEKHYRFQLWGYYNLPHCIFELIGFFMQRYFAFSRYSKKAKRGIDFI